MIDKIKTRLINKCRIDPITQCWNWTGTSDNDGYGNIIISNKRKRSHRVSYEVFKGQIPIGILVCHTCDNTSCINPDHLFLGTSLDNNRDCADKKRNLNTKKTHCPKGHSYTGYNLKIRRRTGSNRTIRMCRTCYNEKFKLYLREYRQRKVA